MNPLRIIENALNHLEVVPWVALAIGLVVLYGIGPWKSKHPWGR